MKIIKSASQGHCKVYINTFALCSCCCFSLEISQQPTLCQADKLLCGSRPRETHHLLSKVFQPSLRHVLHHTAPGKKECLYFWFPIFISVTACLTYLFFAHISFPQQQNAFFVFTEPSIQPILYESMGLDNSN